MNVYIYSFSSFSRFSSSNLSAVPFRMARAKASLSRCFWSSASARSFSASSAWLIIYNRFLFSRNFWNKSASIMAFITSQGISFQSAKLYKYASPHWAPLPGPESHRRWQERRWGVCSPRTGSAARSRGCRCCPRPASPPWSRSRCTSPLGQYI